MGECVCACGIELWGRAVCEINPTGSQLDIYIWAFFAAPLPTLEVPQMSASDGRVKEVLFFTPWSPEEGSISSSFQIHHDGIQSYSTGGEVLGTAPVV